MPPFEVDLSDGSDDSWDDDYYWLHYDDGSDNGSIDEDPQDSGSSSPEVETPDQKVETPDKATEVKSTPIQQPSPGNSNNASSQKGEVKDTTNALQNNNIGDRRNALGTSETNSPGTHQLKVDLGNGAKMQLGEFVKEFSKAYVDVLKGPVGQGALQLGGGAVATIGVTASAFYGNFNAAYGLAVTVPVMAAGSANLIGAMRDPNYEFKGSFLPPGSNDAQLVIIQGLAKGATSNDN